MAKSKENKTVEYPIRLAGKRQITLPASVVAEAGLEQGDELLIVMNGPTDIRLVPCARIRRDLITPKIDAILKQRRAEIRSGAVQMVSQEEVRKRAKVKNQQRRAVAVQDALARAAEQHKYAG
jgi:bifunctional DNA-binding transcriptional regulator/antitoxin component of YhaV-PrlF toxin-antitoxin module